MGDKTAIEWTDSTWNPVTGCTKVSTGCKFCYAERITERLGGDFRKVLWHESRLGIPLRWKRPRRVFTCSMSDLFQDGVPDSFIGKVFGVMAEASRHTFQVLTKRAERLHEWSRGVTHYPGGDRSQRPAVGWPPNVWLGVSCENQEQANKRIPPLLKTPAAVRFVSLEPLLSGIDLSQWLPFVAEGAASQIRIPGIDWVIAGGESGGPPERALVEKCSGPGFHWRPGGPTGPQECHGGCNGTGWRPNPKALAWVRAIRDQCVAAAGVAFHFKQWGGPRPKSGGRMLDGRTWDEYPR